MDDLSRAWAILNLPPGAGAEERRIAYRQLVKKWHPDQFQGNQDQLDEAHEMVKEINWAHDFLDRHDANSAPDVPVEATSPAAIPPDEADKSAKTTQSSRWAFGIICFVLIVLGAIYVGVGSRHKPTPEAELPPSLASVTNPPVAVTNPKPPAPLAAPDPNIVRKMIAANALKITDSADGLILNGQTSRDYLQTPTPVRPPFIFRARLKTSSDFRFFYGLGRIIFNWEENPIELRVHDPATANLTALKRQGGLSHTEWHEVSLHVRTNGLTVTVDGDVRFEGAGFYENLNASIGLGPYAGEAIVKSVSLEEQGPRTAFNFTPQVNAMALPGNLVPTMLPINGLQTSITADGLQLSKNDREPGQIKTEQAFRTPFVIRARAKTDSIDLRLYCGSGIAIFNWESNPAELRIHDPLTGKVAAVPDRGRILPNEWHDFRWEVHRTGMRILVNGQVRYQNRGDYSNFSAPVGIGPFLSKVTVAHLFVDQL